MVATDSYRLSVKETALEAPLRGRASRRTCRRARCRSSRGSRQQRGAETISPSASGRTRSCSRSATIVLSSRLIDGQFPNYRQLLPEPSSTSCAWPARELTDVVRRISLLAQKNAPLRLRFSEGELTVSAQTPDVGEAQRGAARAVPGRAARDRLQPGVPARRPGERRVRASSCSS